MAGMDRVKSWMVSMALPYRITGKWRPETPPPHTRDFNVFRFKYGIQKEKSMPAKWEFTL